MPQNWTISEVEAIVQSYFQMLHWECTGQFFVKAEQRRLLAGKLHNRSKGSIEFKHQNISAVLIKYGLPYIGGYKPRANYQGLLEEAVLQYLERTPTLNDAFEQFAKQALPTIKPEVDYAELLTSPPPASKLKEPPIPYQRRRLSKPNYLQLEQQNRQLGNLGEQLIFEYEQWRLRSAGKPNLADSVEWIARDLGDGAGFDILSRNSNGTDRYIEVKTTKLREFTPIYLTRNELLFSQKNSNDFYLYRVFNYNQSPRFFVKQGALDEICGLEAVGFEGRF